MDFVSGRPETSQGHDVFWVTVDRLSKFGHFFYLLNEGITINKLVKWYIDEIVKLHEISISIVFNRDSHFTSRFGKYARNFGELNCISAQLFILKLTVNQREQYKFQKNNANFRKYT